MPKKAYKPEEIVAKLRQADVLIAQGSKTPYVVSATGVTQVTADGISSAGFLEQVKRMKEIEQENARLRKPVSDLTLDKMIVPAVAKGNF